MKEMNEIRSHTALPTKFHMWLCFCICGWAVIYSMRVLCVCLLSVGKLCYVSFVYGV